MTEHVLTLTKLLDAPRAAIWRCWTEPDLLRQWFAPRPWTTPHAELDVRPGGASLIIMRSPDGAEIPNQSVFLEVVPERRLVMTDAYVRAWVPSAKPFMTVELTMADAGAGGTTYIARAHHWSAEDCAAHEKMGFHVGWGICADQLADLARGLG